MSINIRMPYLQHVIAIGIRGCLLLAMIPGLTHAQADSHRDTSRSTPIPLAITLRQELLTTFATTHFGLQYTSQAHSFAFDYVHGWEPSSPTDRGSGGSFFKPNKHGDPEFLRSYPIAAKAPEWLPPRMIVLAYGRRLQIAQDLSLMAILGAGYQWQRERHFNEGMREEYRQRWDDVFSYYYTYENRDTYPSYDVTHHRLLAIPELHLGYRLFKPMALVATTGTMLGKGTPQLGVTLGMHVGYLGE